MPLGDTCMSHTKAKRCTLGLSEHSSFEMASGSMGTTWPGR